MTLSISSIRPISIGSALAAGFIGVAALAYDQAPQATNPCASAKPATSATAQNPAPPPTTPPPPAQGAAAAAGRAGGPPAKAVPPAGAQIVEGTDDDDRLVGGNGDDWLLAKKGHDWLYGCDGNDKMDGGEGDDHLEGGAGADVIDGGAGRDIIDGGDGNDILDGGDDDSDEDIIYGGPGDDDIDGGDGNAELHGGPGNDLISGSDDSADRIFGDAGNDRLSGHEGNDLISGGAGDDLIFGGDNNDSCHGDGGDDRIDGGEGIDLLVGGPGNDTLLGSTGSDTLHGDDGHDQLFGGDGNDLMHGGPGLDWLMGGQGSDTMFGGIGDDIFVIRAGDVPEGGFELIDGGGGDDVIFLSGFTRAVKVGSEMRVIDPATGGVYIIVNVERVEYTVVVGPSAQPGPQSVSMLLVNPAASPVAGRLLFHGASGALVPATPSGQAAKEVLTFNVPALGSLRLPNISLAEAGVAQVFSNGPVSAAVQGGPGGAVHGVLPLLDTAILPVLESAGTETGFLIANSSTTSSVRVTLRTTNGAELDEQVGQPHQISVPAYGHRVLYIRDLHPRMKEFRGTVTVEGGYNGDWSQEGGAISVLMLSRSGGNVSSVPAIPLSPAAARGPARLARVTSGGSASTSIVLINPASNGRATGTLRLFDESGAPWAALGERPGTTAAVPFDLPAAGSVVVPVSSTVASRGAASAELTRGMIAAMVRTTAAGQFSHAASVEIGEGFITPVFCDRSFGTTTSLSLVAVGEVSIRLELRTAAGVVVPGGEAVLRLAANGSTTRTVEQLFPQAATDAFEGTITVHAEGGNVGVSVVQTGANAATSPALPVIRLQ